MLILHIEHEVPSYDGWKKAFESDPINLRKSGVRHYSILRPVDDPNYVIIDLEFETPEAAEGTIKVLHNLWNKVEGQVMMQPKTRILELVETRDV